MINIVKKRQKKGEILGLPLILIFAMIVGVLILVYGVKVILDLTKESSCIELYSSIKELEGRTELLASADKGSTRTIKIDYPLITTICFFDPNRKIDCRLNSGQCEPFEIEEGFDLILQGTEKNVFVFPSMACDITSYNIANLKPSSESNPLCIRSGNKIRLTTNEGYVSVEFAE